MGKGQNNVELQCWTAVEHQLTCTQSHLNLVVKTWRQMVHCEIRPLLETPRLAYPKILRMSSYPDGNLHSLKGLVPGADRSWSSVAHCRNWYFQVSLKMDLQTLNKISVINNPVNRVSVDWLWHTMLIKCKHWLYVRSVSMLLVVVKMPTGMSPAILVNTICMDITRSSVGIQCVAGKLNPNMMHLEGNYLLTNKLREIWCAYTRSVSIWWMWKSLFVSQRQMYYWTWKL